MKEKFNEWNEIKKEINDKKRQVHFRQGEICFLHVGLNIGYESYGKK